MDHEQFQLIQAELARIGIKPQQLGNFGFSLRSPEDMLPLLRSVPTKSGLAGLEARLREYRARGDANGGGSGEGA